MAYTADVNRWRGPVEEPYRPHMFESSWHPGWIAVTILGFIIWWPIGLALLFYTLGSRKMACWGHQDAFLDFAVEVFPNGRKALIQKSLLHIAQNHFVASARKHVRDPVAHRPRAQHRHRLD